MTEARIDSRSPALRSAAGVQRTGTATDRRPRRQEAEDKRKDGDGSRKRRHLYDLLFEEIDQVPELEAHQRERLKRNIRTHLALRARDQTPLPSVLPEAKPAPPQQPVAAAEKGAEQSSERPPPDDSVDHDHLIGIAAPLSPDLPPDEFEQNAQLAKQLRDCLARNTSVARKVASYLKILLSIDGALDPHVIIDI